MRWPGVPKDQLAVRVEIPYVCMKNTMRLGVWFLSTHLECTARHYEHDLDYFRLFHMYI